MHACNGSMRASARQRVCEGEGDVHCIILSGIVGSDRASDDVSATDHFTKPRPMPTSSTAGNGAFDAIEQAYLLVLFGLQCTGAFRVSRLAS